MNQTWVSSKHLKRDAQRLPIWMFTISSALLFRYSRYSSILIYNPNYSFFTPSLVSTNCIVKCQHLIYPKSLISSNIEINFKVEFESLSHSTQYRKNPKWYSNWITVRAKLWGFLLDAERIPFSNLLCERLLFSNSIGKLNFPTAFSDTLSPVWIRNMKVTLGRFTQDWQVFPFDIALWAFWMLSQYKFVVMNFQFINEYLNS